MPTHLHAAGYSPNLSFFIKSLKYLIKPLISLQTSELQGCTGYFKCCISWFYQRRFTRSAFAPGSCLYDRKFPFEGFVANATCSHYLSKRFYINDNYCPAAKAICSRSNVTYLRLSQEAVDLSARKSLDQFIDRIIGWMAPRTVKKEMTFFRT